MTDVTAVDLSAPVHALWPFEREPTATRALSCLRRGGIRTIGNLADATPREITDLRLAGPAILAEVRAALAEHGLSLRGDDGATPAEVEARVRRLTRAGVRRGVAERFAREQWPKGEIGPGLMLEVSDCG